MLVIGYFLLPTPKENYNVKRGYKWEAYDPTLAYRLKSVDNIISLSDSVIGKDKRQSLEYLGFLNKIISNSFYHGYSYYSFHHNWIAFIAAKLFWKDLNAVVDADDILKHPEAACSQVSIVLASCLKTIHVPYRKIALKGHFILEANIHNKWFVYDPNLEPQFINGRKSLKELIGSNELFAAYAGRQSNANLVSIFSSIHYDKVNGDLAPRAFIFHKCSFVLSILIAGFLLIYVLADLSRTIYPHLLTIIEVSISEKQTNQYAIEKIVGKEEKASKILKV
ncbi:MAG: hypothetical protein NVSMB67_15860 [Flavisolibacter sp.]